MEDHRGFSSISATHRHDSHINDNDNVMRRNDNRRGPREGAPKNPDGQSVNLRRALLEVPEVDMSNLLGYDGDITSVIDHARCGLRNIGNTCYLNALLHALARIPAVMHWCYIHLECSKGDASHARPCCLCNLAQDLRMIKVDNACTAIPITASTRGDWGGERFANNAQQDAHEVFRALMEQCDNVDAVAARNLNIPAYFRHNTYNSVRYSTPFWKIFGGKQLSTVIFCACHHRTSQYEMWDSLSLALPKQTESLEARQLESCFSLIVTQQNLLAPRPAQSLFFL